MKKSLNSLVYYILIFTIFCYTFFSNNLTAHARPKEPLYTMSWKIDREKIHIAQNDFRGTYISIQFPDKGYKVTNLSSSSIYCIPTIANRIVTTKQEMTDGNRVLSDNFYSAQDWIELNASKKGTYQVKFDIEDPAGKIVKSKSLTVYAYKENPIQSVTINDKVLQNFHGTFCTSGKYIVLKVKMNPGYKLIRIVKEESERPDKIIKNAKKFQAYRTNEDFRIVIYYKDKYTGRTERKNFWLEQWKG